MNQDWMTYALDLARQAAKHGEVPVGAVIIHNNHPIAQCHNLVESTRDPTAHAELLAIRKAARVLNTQILDQCDLYVTLEPCAMCAGAIAWSRVKRVFFAAYDPKSGGVEHGACVFSHNTCHHHPEIYGGFMETESQNLLRAFFKGLRK